MTADPRSSLEALIAELKANKYFRSRPPLFMKRNRQYLSLVRRLVQKIERDAALAAQPAIPQEDLPPEAAKVLRDHAWELIDGVAAQPAPTPECPEATDGRHVFSLAVRQKRHEVVGRQCWKCGEEQLFAPARPPEQTP